MSSGSLPNTQKEKGRRRTERNFHLFYSLTKLTSILFLPFYSNIIKAVRSERDGECEDEEEKQFVTLYHCERCVFATIRPYSMCGVCWQKRARNEVQETRLLILHEMDSKLCNV